MIVVTLSKVPPSLRGTLTKWYQEIQTGVFVGSVSARIRDQLWKRILRDIGSGEATMVYNAQNELGYQFRTTRKDHVVVDYDGIPLMMRLKASPTPVKPGFSDAAHYHRARMGSRSQAVKKKAEPAVVKKLPDFVVIDTETTGLTPGKDQIISIGAVKQSQDGKTEDFYQLVKIDQPLPAGIAKLTGLSDSEIDKKGVAIGDALIELKNFISELPIVGYNLPFDDEFISAALVQAEQEPLRNQMIDLMPIVKKKEMFLDNFKLSTVLVHYKIQNLQPHNSLADAQATFELATQLIENTVFTI